MAGRVLSELAGARDGVTLVVDDLHELRSPEALAQLTRLLTSLPPRVNAILATRHDLRLGLQQLRLAGSWPRSARRICASPSAKHVSFSMPRVSRCRRPERRCCTSGPKGGPRACGSRRSRLAGHRDPERFVAEFSGSDRTVAEYLLAEMLDRQPDRRQGSVTAHLPARPGQRRAGRSADRPPRLGTDPAESGRRERVRRIAGPRARPGSATTTCSRICCGWSCAGHCLRTCRCCTGAPRNGSPSRARWPRPSGTPRRRATGLTRPGCSPAIRSA